MKKVVFTVALAMASCVAFGQIKAVKQAKREADAKNLTEAEKLINGALTNPESKDAAETWNVAGYIQSKIVDDMNTKAYTKQKFDTLKLYNGVYQMFQYYNKCDELEQIPDKKGKVKIKYRKNNAAALLNNRPNLINGGVLFFNQGKDADAYKYFDLYLNTVNYPMLQEANLAQTDSMLNMIAYYASLAAVKMAQATPESDKSAADAAYKEVLKHVDRAIQDPENGRYAFEFKCTAYKALGDTAQWLKTLQDGMQAYPEHTYFFGNLVDYYSNSGKFVEAIKFTDEMIAKNGSTAFYQYVKGYFHQSLKDYENAIASYKIAIEKDPNYVEAYSNLGMCYCQQGIDYGDKAMADIDDPNYEKEQAKIKTFYEQAKPYYEKARQLAPDKKELWMSGLYNVYYRLNMGDEFKEIESMMQE